MVWLVLSGEMAWAETFAVFAQLCRLGVSPGIQAIRPSTHEKKPPAHKVLAAARMACRGRQRVIG
jgi:hypothetical protein